MRLLHQDGFFFRSMSYTADEGVFDVNQDTEGPNWLSFIRQTWIQQDGIDK